MNASQFLLPTQLQGIKSWFDLLASTKGKAKEPVIRDMCKSYLAAATALKFLLDPGVVFHIGKKSFEKPLPREKAQEYLPPDLFGLCSFLMNKTALTDADIATVQWTLNQVEDAALRQFGQDYLCKSISLGVTAKTVNKALGCEFIPEFRCMLANKYFEHPDKVEGRHFYLTEKLDGIRCLAIVEEDRVRLFSRQGQPIEGLTEIEDDLRTVYRNAKACVLDGELLISDRDGLPSKEQYKRTTQIVRKDGPKTGITYHVFDVLDVDAFEHRFCDTPYYLRRQRLESYVRGLRHIRALPVLYHGNDTEEITRHLNLQRDLRHEGIMINLAHAPYQFTRTNALLKVKVMQDCDLEIIGVEEGQGKFAGTLGALVVDYKGHPVGVGSGLSDGMRRLIWENPDAYIGRVATVQYFEESNDAKGNPSIRFPVFKELREEGKEVSYS